MVIVIVRFPGCCLSVGSFHDTLVLLKGSGTRVEPACRHRSRISLFSNNSNDDHG
jgi:hypothetical protein